VVQNWQNAYLLCLTATLILGTLLLAILQENRILIYLTVLTLTYFANSLVFGPKRKYFDFVGVALLALWVIGIYLTILTITTI
jgi:hypothetical protein